MVSKTLYIVSRRERERERGVSSLDLLYCPLNFDVDIYGIKLMNMWSSNLFQFQAMHNSKCKLEFCLETGFNI